MILYVTLATSHFGVRFTQYQYPGEILAINPYLGIQDAMVVNSPVQIFESGDEASSNIACVFWRCTKLKGISVLSCE